MSKTRLESTLTPTFRHLLSQLVSSCKCRHLTYYIEIKHMQFVQEKIWINYLNRQRIESRLLRSNMVFNVFTRTRNSFEMRRFQFISFCDSLFWITSEKLLPIKHLQLIPSWIIHYCMYLDLYAKSNIIKSHKYQACRWYSKAMVKGKRQGSGDSWWHHWWFFLS